MNKQCEPLQSMTGSAVRVSLKGRGLKEGLSVAANWGQVTVVSYDRLIYGIAPACTCCGER